MKKEIVDFLPVGEKNAITQRELATLLHCSKRIARSLIYEARCKGAVICSSVTSNGGYFLPATNGEVKRFILFQRHRIASTKAAIQSAERFLKRGGFK